MKILNFAVVGHPIGHTMSPFIQSRLFSLSGINGHYSSLDIAPESLGKFILEQNDWNGFNFTIPHKRAVIPYLDALDQKAQMIGSVNTVKIENGKRTGFTTDGDGFRLSLQAAGIPLKGRAVILGAGGAARAIAFEAALAGCTITVAAREHSFPSAVALCADLNQNIPGAQAEACRISEITGTMELLINATPAGMYPDIQSCAADEKLVRRSGCVFDAVYNPQETRLIRLAKQNGIPAVGGMAMLVWQAAAAQTIWTGAEFRAEDVAPLCDDANLEMKKKFGNCEI
ncbi:MAG: shikimate dehydrogenase [Oscillospiraceae bacterium]|jgi:shikimate dehydrogenase|nr:shikimate dehydrogenase [Oscillospiraceae bacterium]